MYILWCTNPFTNYNALASVDDGSCTFSSSTICDVPSFTEDWSSASWDTTNGYAFGTNGWMITDTPSALQHTRFIYYYFYYNEWIKCIEFTGGDGTAGWGLYY